MRNSAIYLLALGIMLLDCTASRAQAGLQITDENIPFSIDFETTTTNVNDGVFAGNGFQSVPEIGQLDSDTWELHGLSDGNLSFGDTKTDGDFARGTSGISVSIGGIYSFLVAPGNNILGMQATANDLTPGSVTLRIQNKTGSVINTLAISYIAYIYNDQPGRAYFGFGGSDDNISFTEVLAGSLISDDVAADSPSWEANHLNFKITELAIAANDYYYIQWNIKNTGAGQLDQFGLDNITIVANPPAVAMTYVYDGHDEEDDINDWTPYNPNLSPASLSFDTNILIQNGTAVLNQDFAINKITILSGASVKIKKSLQVQEGIENNGHLIFVSDDQYTGQLGNMTNAVISGSGEITVQRHIPVRDDGKGAYRYLTSAVNSTGSIHANWQEGATGINDNPNPGYGIFITGSATGSNGFDKTPAGDPSMFRFNSNTQSWTAVPNTDSDPLIAGHAYGVYIWGDRSVNIVPDNDPVATSTILRATGNLVTGDHTIPLSGPNNFNLIGNPYQSIVNIRDVVTQSTNVNTNFYYVWDPNLGIRGANTTVNLTFGSNNSSESASEANQYLMPGQAAWVLTTDNGASLLFTEETKSVLADPTEVFRQEGMNIASIELQLFQAERFADGQTLSDALRIFFSETASNAVLPNDALKLPNMDENLARLNGSDFLSIENRALPTDGEVLSLVTNQHRVNNYVFRASLKNMPDGITAYLVDNYLDNKTPLPPNETTLIDFSVDESIPASIVPNRFSIGFSTDPLSVNDGMSSPTLSIYPNPVQNGEFFIAMSGIAGEKVEVALYTILGQKVHKIQKTGNTDNRVRLSVPSLEAGVYLVKMKHHGKTIGGKVLVR